MSTSELRRTLIKKLDNVEEPVLREVLALLKFEESKSEYKLNNAEKLSVEIGISQIANGEFVTNEALARDTELWLKK